MSEPADELYALDLRSEADVFTARQLIRQIAEVIGLEAQDQVRVATALSEVGRQAVAVDRGRVVFAFPDHQTLTVTVQVRGRDPWTAGDRSAGLTAVARLVDRLNVRSDGDLHAVVLAKSLRAAVTFDADERRALRAQLEATAPRSALDEIRSQNVDLIVTLEQLQGKQQELLRLNAELEETNQGVLALYNQLSAELEETNRGVVALYAELDERGMELARADEAKNRSLHMISHELRTPVNSIIGLTKLLLDPGSDPMTTEQRQQAQFILTSGDDLSTLVNALLDWAKADSGRLEIVSTPVDPANLFGELDGTIRPLVVRPEVEFVVDPPVGVPELNTDATLLRRVLGNLLTNAVKFTERGEIRLSAAATDGETVTFTVADSGIGLAGDDLDRVFEEFFQVQHRLQAGTRGTGLGLPYARRVTELLGGRLELTSSVGRGSTFTVALPTGARPTADILPGRPGERRIPLALIIDDDQPFRRILADMLADLTDRVVEADDVPQALARLREDTPSVVFLDLRTPIADSGIFLTALAEDPALSEVPVIVVTSADRSSFTARGTGPVAATVTKHSLNQPLLAEILGRVLPDGP